jgi:hypothetical protein
MPKHQAYAYTPQPIRSGPLSRNEHIAAGFTATLDMDDNVLAVTMHGLHGDLSPEDNEALRFFHD